MMDEKQRRAKREALKALVKKEKDNEKDVLEKVFKNNQRKFDYQKKASPSTYSGLDSYERGEADRIRGSLKNARELDVWKEKLKQGEIERKRQEDDLDEFTGAAAWKKLFKKLK